MASQVSGGGNDTTEAMYRATALILTKGIWAQSDYMVLSLEAAVLDVLTTIYIENRKVRHCSDFVSPLKRG